jgi:hypothetical protein
MPFPALASKNCASVNYLTSVRRKNMRAPIGKPNAALRGMQMRVWIGLSFPPAIKLSRQPPSKRLPCLRDVSRKQISAGGARALQQQRCHLRKSRPNEAGSEPGRGE